MLEGGINYFISELHKLEFSVVFRESSAPTIKTFY